MTTPDRVLRPLDEAAASIDKLDSYESPAVLQEALRATWHAVELTLRRLLRSDATAPDEVRMTALSADQMPADTLLQELRRRDLISLPLAGRIHEFRQALGRTDAVRAADADTALEVVRQLRAESVRPWSGAVFAVEPGANPGARSSVEAATPGRPADDSEPDRAAADSIPDDPTRGPRRPLYLMLGTAAVLVAVVVATLLFGRESHFERGVRAFEDGRSDVAEQHFRAAMRGDAGNVTTRLYLARILRSQDRDREAADLLTDAVMLAPADAAVRRELGYLFVTLGRGQAAIEQFETAVELEPDEPLNWVGLVQALRREGDPAWQEWLDRAPAAAREIMQ